MAKIKCILDTDIGDDIDDTWALLLLLLSSEIEPILITTCWGDTTYRAKIIAKILTALNCTHIPIGIGIATKPSHIQAQQDWVCDYDLDAYKGTVHKDGVSALIKSVMTQSDTISLICIGPLTNIASALQQEPNLTEKAKFVGMLGSVRKGYLGMSKVVAEHNVRMDIPAAQFVFKTKWAHGFAFTPIDSSGLVKLEGNKFEKLVNSKTAEMKIVMDNYRIWLESRGKIPIGAEIKASSILFDTVAVYMVWSRNLLIMEKLPITITDDGFTVIDSSGTANVVDVATGWKNLSAFNHMLVERFQGTINSKL